MFTCRRIITVCVSLWLALALAGGFNEIVSASDISPTDKTPTANTPPVVYFMDSLSIQTEYALGINVWNFVEDAETDDSLLTYDFTTSNDSILATFFASTGLLNLSSVTGFIGEGLLYITVTDPDLASASDTVVVTITAAPNDPPTVELPDSLGFDEGTYLTIDYWSMVTDESDDSLLTYDFTVSNDSLLMIDQPDSGLLTLSAESGFTGEAMLYLTVTDPNSAETSDTSLVQVFPVLDADGATMPIPTSFALRQNYPNPFNPSTVILFDIPERTHIELTVYNILGGRVCTLINGTCQAGSHTAIWSGRDDAGRQMASGIYFYRLESEEFVDTRKMVLLK